jgi:hypothetical protein
MNSLPVEISRQHLPSDAVGSREYFELAPSRPLHELAAEAPALDDEPFKPWLTDFPRANDESAIYWRQTRARTETAEYQKATNRTALLVGESSLISALPYIPEDTIIIINNNPHSSIYMQHYIDALRTAPTIQDWFDQMEHRMNPYENDDWLKRYKQQFLGVGLDRQLKQWQDAGMEQGLDDEEAYRLSSQLAREKAIIPWEANLQDPAAMERLNQALRAHKATITFVNLANVMEWLKDVSPRPPLALEDLPMTEYAPILTTAMVAVPKHVRRIIMAQIRQDRGQAPRDQSSVKLAGPVYLSAATGPFFGLRNFFEQGGNGPVDGEERLLNAVFTRKYHTPDDAEKPAS